MTNHIIRRKQMQRKDVKKKLAPNVSLFVHFVFVFVCNIDAIGYTLAQSRLHQRCVVQYLVTVPHTSRIRNGNNLTLNSRKIASSRDADHVLFQSKTPHKKKKTIRHLASKVRTMR